MDMETSNQENQSQKPEAIGIKEEAKKMEDSKKIWIGRSVSLSHTDQKRKDPRTPSTPPRPKREKNQTPSPRKKTLNYRVVKDSSKSHIQMEVSMIRTI